MKASPESIKNTTVNTVFYAREDNSSVYSNKNTSCLTAERIYIIYYNFIIIQFHFFFLSSRGGSPLRTVSSVTVQRTTSFIPGISYITFVMI